MNKQQLIDQAKKEFKDKFAHEYDSGSYIQVTMEAIEPIEEFITKAIESAYDKGREDEKHEFLLGDFSKNKCPKYECSKTN